MWHKLLPVKSRALIGWDASRTGPLFSGNGPVRISSAILLTKEQQKEILKSRKNGTNSVNYESDDEQSESEFYYKMKHIPKNNVILKTQDMSQNKAKL